MEKIIEHDVSANLNDDVLGCLGKKTINKKLKLMQSRAIALCSLYVLSKNTAWKITAFDAVKDFGLAGLQWAKHLSSQVKIMINCSENLKSLVEENLKLNGCALSDDLTIASEDPQAHMHNSKYGFIYAEIYGCAVAYLDAALRSIKHGGILVVTSTDTSILQNKSPETSHRLYGVKLWKTEYHKEFSCRIILENIARAAARWSKGIKVELCTVLEHGITIVCRVHRGAQFGENTMANLHFLAHCQLCQARAFISHSQYLPETSSMCDCFSNGLKAPVLMLGPVWSGKISDKGFLLEILEAMTSLSLNKDHVKLIEQLIIESACCANNFLEAELLKDIKEIKTKNSNEPQPKRVKLDSNCATTKDSENLSKNVDIDLASAVQCSTPFYFDIQHHSVRGGNPPTVVSVINKLRSDGYSACKTHFGPRCIKTSATLTVFKQVLQYLWDHTKNNSQNKALITCT